MDTKEKLSPLTLVIERDGTNDAGGQGACLAVIPGHSTDVEVVVCSLEDEKGRRVNRKQNSKHFRPQKQTPKTHTLQLFQKTFAKRAT